MALALACRSSSSSGGLSTARRRRAAPFIVREPREDVDIPRRRVAATEGAIGLQARCAQQAAAVMVPQMVLTTARLADSVQHFLAAIEVTIPFLLHTTEHAQ
jgi:hypothetical protein